MKETDDKKCYPAVAIHREEQSMSKFQAEYSIAHQSFKDFILIIFVLIDDLYKKVTPNQVNACRNIDKALLSDSEIITIALCGEIVGVDSENAWYALVKKNFRHLFPKMCTSVNLIVPAAICYKLQT